MFRKYKVLKSRKLFTSKNDLWSTCNTIVRIHRSKDEKVLQYRKVLMRNEIVDKYCIFCDSLNLSIMSITKEW